MHLAGRLALLVLLPLLLAGVARADAKNGRLDVYFVDVEGGAATLFVTPAGESLLIDSGYPDNNGRDRDRILRVAKEVAGLERIDHAAVTHWHADHFGNHAALSTQIPIGTFWDRGIPETLQEDERIAEYRRATQNDSKTLRAGDTLPLKSMRTRLGVTIATASREVIPNDGPPNPFAKLHVPQAEDKSDNADSLTFLLNFGPFRFLCCGDLTWNVEGKLVTPNNPLGTVDVFMVTHHGLPNSNNPALVLAIDPTVAVMCNGPTKGGAKETIETLRKVKSLKHLYQLHENVKLTAPEQTPAEFIANATPTIRCEGRFVHLSVAPDGSSYTIRIEGRDEVREYETRERD
jgi:competence protein ComEC